MMAPAQYACKCLNVRIRAHPHSSSPPSPPDPPFHWVHAGETGISTVHSQLTLRHRSSPSAPSSSTSPRIQYINLCCLACDMLVYRVAQPASDGVDLVKEALGHLRDDWTETDVLQSSTGWIETHTDSLKDEEILSALKSPLFSPTFSVLLPAKEPSSSPLFPDNRTSSPIPFQDTVSLAEVKLPNLPAVLPPPPFVPSHAIFNHLASAVFASSERLRARADEDLQHFALQKLSEIEAAELAMRQDIDGLWRSVRSSLHRVKRSDDHVTNARVATSPNRRSRAASVTLPAHSEGQGTGMSIRDFRPISVATARRDVRSVAPPRSGLSASFVTNDFTYPQDERQTLSRPSLTSTSAQTLVDEAADAPIAFKRNMDPLNDIVASFRWTTAQEGMDAARRKHDGVSNGDAVEQATPMSNHLYNASIPPRATSEQGNTGSPNLKEALPGKKGKRRVTFDVEPDVAINHAERPYGPSVEEQADEAIFDLDEEQDLASHSGDKPSSPTPPQPSISDGPLLSLPSTEAGDPSQNKGDVNGLGIDSNVVPTSSHEEELMKLVGAQNPSHRHAWKEGRKAWDIFDTMKQQHLRWQVERKNEEVFNSADRASPDSQLGTSLPILMHAPISHPAARSAVAASLQARGHASSWLGARQSLYAERDRQRSKDPGALDFSIERDGDESDGDTVAPLPTHPYADPAGSKGRDRALRILQKRAQAPAEGMWRSLA